MFDTWPPQLEKIERKMERQYFFKGLLISAYVIENKQLSRNLEIRTLEIILDTMKILLTGLYKPPSFNEIDFLFHLNNAYNFFCNTYENITLIGDFNDTIKQKIKCFLFSVKLTNLTI